MIQFPYSLPAWNHGSFIHHHGLGVCYDEYNYHDSQQTHLIEGIDHWHFSRNLLSMPSLSLTFFSLFYLRTSL